MNGTLKSPPKISNQKEPNKCTEDNEAESAEDSQESQKSPADQGPLEEEPPEINGDSKAAIEDPSEDPSNVNSLTNGDEEITKIDLGVAENEINDHHYVTAQTLRVGSVREKDTFELSIVASTDAHYNRNTDVYKKTYSSSENIQETDKLFKDPAIESKLDESPLNNIPDKLNKENEQVMIRESEYGFKYEEKHYVSKLEKGRTDSSRYKALCLESNITEKGSPVITTQPSLQKKRDEREIKSLPMTNATQQGPPVITTQPPLQRTRDGTVEKPWLTTQPKITDEVDSKICLNSEKKQEYKDKYTDIYDVKYKDSCVLDCFCGVLECCM